MSPADRKVLLGLYRNERLTFNERGAICDLVREYDQMIVAKSWEDPYAKAIALLESASRSHQGNFS